MWMVSVILRAIFKIKIFKRQKQILGIRHFRAADPDSSKNNLPIKHSICSDILSSIFPSCPSFKFATISLLWHLHMPTLHSRSCILLVCLRGVDADQVRKVTNAFAHACRDGRPSAGYLRVWIADILPISVTKSSNHAAGWMVPYPNCLVLYAGIKISHRNAEPVVDDVMIFVDIRDQSPDVEIEAHPINP